MTESKLAEIEAAAKGASEHKGWGLLRCDMDGGEIIWQIQINSGDEAVFFSESDLSGPGVRVCAHYIATADPPTVLSLVAEVRRLREQASRDRPVVEAARHLHWTSTPSMPQELHSEAMRALFAALVSP